MDKSMPLHHAVTEKLKQPGADFLTPFSGDFLTPFPVI
jgi:hypothetical protein